MEELIDIYIRNGMLTEPQLNNMSTNQVNPDENSDEKDRR